MFACVTIVPDLTKTQRKGEMRLREEAERRNQDLTEEERERNLQWIVVGSRGEKRIIKGTERDKNSGQGGGSGGSGLGGEGVLEGGGGEVTPPQTATRDTLHQQATGDQQTSRPTATATAMHSTATATSTVTEQTPALILFPDKTRLDPATAPAAAPQATATRATTTATQTTAVATTATTDTATTLATSSAAIDTAITAGEAEADPT